MCNGFLSFFTLWFSTLFSYLSVIHLPKRDKKLKMWILLTTIIGITIRYFTTLLNYWLRQQLPALWLTCWLEDSRVALAVPRGKRLHHTVDFLGFTWQTETPQELPTITEKWGVVQMWCHRESQDISVWFHHCADRSAWTRLRSANSCSSTKACSTLMLKSSLVERKMRKIWFPILFSL